MALATNATPYWSKRFEPTTIQTPSPAPPSPRDRTTMADNIAPPGKLWVCCACGKTTRDKYGNEGRWDESCMLNSILSDESHLVRGANGRVTEILAEAANGLR